MTGPVVLRWVYTDGRAHVLTADGDAADSDAADGLPASVTVCGLGVAAPATVYRVPPSLDVCRSCVPLPGDGPSSPGPFDVPPPTFPTPTVF